MDYNEVIHGMNCVRTAWKSKRGCQLQQLLDAQYAGLAGRIADMYDGWSESGRRPAVVYEYTP